MGVWGLGRTHPGVAQGCGYLGLALLLSPEDYVVLPHFLVSE